MRFFILLLGFIFSISQVFAQSWEVLRIDDKQATFFDACEDEQQDLFIVGTIDQYKNTNFTINSEDLLLMKITSQGDTISKIYSEMGYVCKTPYIIFSDNKEVIIIYILTSCLNPLSPNYIISDTISCKLIFAKVDQDLNLYQINENILYLHDITRNCYYSKQPILKNGLNYTIVLCEYNGYSFKNNFLCITLNDSGQIEKKKEYPIAYNNLNGTSLDTLYATDHFYLTYNNDHSGFLVFSDGYQGYDFKLLNSNFDIIYTAPIPIYEIHIGPEFPDTYVYPYISNIIPSLHDKSFFLPYGYYILPAQGGLAQYGFGVKKIDTTGSILATHEKKLFEAPSHSNNQVLSTTLYSFQNKNEQLFFAAFTCNIYDLIGSYHTYVILHHLNENLELQNEYYYHYNEDAHVFLSTVYTSQDGGCILLGRIYDWNGLHQVPHYDPIVVKYSPEAFTSIDEAHKSNLSMAIAYPNPGNDQLFIRTTIPNAYVEICDISGKLMASQKIHTIETKFDVNNWNSGIYIWRVICNGNVIETGKWIKE